MYWLSLSFAFHQKSVFLILPTGDIGGSLGLFIGASMLTIVEIVDLVLLQLPLFRNWRWKRKEKEKKELPVQVVSEEYIWHKTWVSMTEMKTPLWL